MKKRVLLIITISMIVILVSVGVIYFISYKNSNFSNVEYESSISSISEDKVNDAEAINDEVSNIISNETENNANNTVVEEKKIEQTPITTAQATTSTKSSNPSNNSKTKETVKESKSSSTATQTQTQSTTQSQNSQTSKTEEAKQPEAKVERCTNNNNHSMNVGNSGKWFNSKSEAIAFYNEKIAYWGEQWESNKIDNDTYYKNCPYGYEIWDCMYCGKWTINFYYR